MLNVLVTGGAGFLGAAFTRRAIAAGHAVKTLDSAAGANYVCDIGDERDVRRALEAARPEVLVHLAAQLTDTANGDPVGAVRVNALGTAVLFACAEQARVGRVIYASSNAAVGPCPEGSGDATPLDPRSIYGVTKAFGEHLARAMSTRPAAPRYLALRFGWVYGPGRQRGWRDVQDLIERVADGERAIRYPDFSEPIDWTFVDDAADTLLRGLDCPLAAFAAVNAVGQRRSIGDAIAHLRRRFPDLVAEPVAAEAPPSGWGLVNQRLASLIGQPASTSLETGIDRILAARAESAAVAT
jgi:nucleoside-diphosphate-sugar epimerase